MGMLIWQGDKASLRTFSSSSKGGATTIRIELTVADPIEAGFIMANLAETQAEGKEARKPVKAPKPTKATMRALPSPMLALPAPRGGDHA